jgi:hypothetical protein
VHRPVTVVQHNALADLTQPVTLSGTGCSQRSWHLITLLLTLAITQLFSLKFHLQMRDSVDAAHSLAVIPEKRVIDSALCSPILRVTFISEDGPVVASFDNRRLFSANLCSEEDNSVVSSEIGIELHDQEETIAGKPQLEADLWNCFLTFAGWDVDPTLAGVFQLEITPKTYGALLCMRYVLQGHAFPFTARRTSHTEPRAQHRPSDIQVKKRSSYMDDIIIAISAKVAIVKLEDLLRNNVGGMGLNGVCVSHSGPGQKFQHPELHAYLTGRCDMLFHVRSARFSPLKYLKAAADFDDQDRAVDREAAEYDRVYVQDLQHAEIELWKEVRG